MPVYKYQKGWYVKTNFKDADGVNRQHCKRGFRTKKEAETYEADYKAALRLCPSTGAPTLTELLHGILKANNIATPNAAPEPVDEPKEPEKTFQEVFDEYWSATIDKGIKAGTQETKRNVFEQHVLPHFQDLELTAITTDVIKQWQTEMQQKERREKKFSQTYLHSIQSQFNAVLNYAVRKKYLPFSPMVDLKNMGEKNAAPREIWTPDEYAQFAQYAKTRPDTFMLFELYYWVGLRRGEALGLRPMDIQYDARVGKTIITITTSVDAKKRVGDTKTASSYRTVAIPQTVADELTEYMAHIYDLKSTDRIFGDISVSHLYRDVVWAIERSGLPKICIHGMRHSWATNIISSGEVTATDAARLMGHASQQTTLRTYAHILPTTQAAAADYMDAMRSKF